MPSSVSIEAPFHVSTTTEIGADLAQFLADAQNPAIAFARRIRSAKKTMLDVATLAALQFCVSRSDAPVIEAGAYIGGATLAMRHASNLNGNSIISVEYGISYDHPEIPTADSLLDLQKNVRDWGLDDPRHLIIGGWSLEAWVVGNILLALKGRQAGLLVVDTDSFTDRDFLYLSPLLAEGALLAFDDYYTSDMKSDRIRPFVEEMIAAGVLCEIAMLSWGTWFGQMVRRPEPEIVAAYMAKWREEDHSWVHYLDRQRREQHLPRHKDEMKAIRT